MADAQKVQIELVKLAIGARLLRFTDAKSGFSVERNREDRQLRPGRTGCQPVAAGC